MYVFCFILDLVQEQLLSLMNNHFYIITGIKKLIIQYGLYGNCLCKPKYRVNTYSIFFYPYYQCNILNNHKKCKKISFLNKQKYVLKYFLMLLALPFLSLNQFYLYKFVIWSWNTTLAVLQLNGCYKQTSARINNFLGFYITLKSRFPKPLQLTK